MKNMNSEQIEKAQAAKCAEAQELSDEMLDGVAGGLVQLVNPSSGSYQYFLDGTVCQHCGYSHGTYTKILRRMECNKCREKMVSRRVKPAEVGYFTGSGCL